MTTSTDYARHKESTARRQRTLALAGRDIAPMPPIRNPSRRRSTAIDFREFCEKYQPATYSLAWSGDHLKVINRIETAVLRGGLFALAMPRGSGKTSLAESACLWALLFAHRAFVALIGADEAHAVMMLDSIKTEIELNDRLLDDFPEICYPVRALDGIHQRASGQLYRGEQTHILWRQRDIVLPSIAGSRAAGAICRVAGLTGAGIRGMKFKRPDGEPVRPSLVILDDPQTDESARSVAQCETRESILAGAVLGMAGPSHKIAGVMPCTVIRQGDMADRILDRETHPDWQGERTRLVYDFPSNTGLWDEYAQIRAEDLQSGGDGSAATKFYAAHRNEMDEGATVAWPERYNHDELSAIQHAQNLLFRDKAAFFAEFQNEPLDEHADAAMLTATEIAALTNGRARRVVPIHCSHLTGFIDVHQSVLYYVILALSDDFTGSIIDYGTYPDQRLPYFTLQSARRTLARAAPRAGLEGAIYAGLGAMTAGTAKKNGILAREYHREDGVRLRVERCPIDANWGQSTDTIYKFCRESPFAPILTPSHGRGVRAGNKPFAEYRNKRGDRRGLNWRMPAVHDRRLVRHMIYDTNFWKSAVHARLAAPAADPGAIDLFESATGHRMLADHLTAEYRIRTEGRGRTVDEWSERPGQDNHFFDCFVGACVAGAMCGCTIPGTAPAAKSRRKPRPKFTW